MMNKRPTSLLFLAFLLRFFSLSSCVYRVYICRSELHSIFEGTEFLDTVSGHHVDIIRHGSVHVLNGSLQLTMDGGSGMLLVDENPLPPIPNSVEGVTISWHANEAVSYFLEVDAVPEDHFRMVGKNVSETGAIPREKSGFQLTFDCDPASVGSGQLKVNLTTVINSTGEVLTADFYLERICKGVLDSSIGGSGMMTSDTPITLSATPSRSSPSALTTSTTRIRSSPSSNNLLMPFSTSEEPVAVQTTFDLTSSPSPTATVHSSLLDDVFIPFSSTLLEIVSSSALPESSVVQTPSPSPSPSPSSSSRVELMPSAFATSLDSSSNLFTAIQPSSSLVVSPSPSPSPLVIDASSPVALQPSLIPDVPSPSSSSFLQSSPDLPSPFPSPFPRESSITEAETPLSSSPSPLPTNLEEKVNGTEIDKKSQLGDLLFIAFAPVVAILALSICILLFCVCGCVVKRRRKQPSRVFSDDPLDLPVRYSREVTERELEESFTKNTGPPLTLWMALSWGTVSTLPAGVQSIIKHYAVDRRSLSILSTVAREDYGAIVRGQWCDPACGDRGVRMKILTGFQKQYGHRDEIVHFVELATLLRGRDHPNLHKVLKVSVEDNYIPVVVYPIVEYGNLHQFLTFCRSSPSESPLNGRYRKLLTSATPLPVTNQYKVNFAYQIVSAMSYLCEEGIVHPDLALRNCLLDTNYSVKVADGALSELFFPECYYNVKGTVRPVRWAAIETLHSGHLTSHSNVWSYGVTVWEIMTLAQTPYSDVDNNRSVLSCLMMGQRLPKPDDCPSDMYAMMMSCWNEEPVHRLTFEQLRAHIFDVSGRYTPLPALDDDQSVPSISVHPAGGSGHSTPALRNGAVQQNPAPVPVQPVVVPQYEPVVYDDHNMGDRKVSGASLGSSLRSRESLQPDKLSITFSVLSEDVLGEGEGSSSENSEEEEEGEDENLDVLDPDLLHRFMPSMRREQQLPPNQADVGNVRQTLNNDLQRAALSPASTVVGGDLEDTLKYSRLPPTVLSPGPLSTSTMTSRLSPCETHSCSSSQYGLSTVRSEETPVPGVSSPSPDLTSKTSTIGDETLSIASNPLLTTVYHSTPLAPPPTVGGGAGNGALGKVNPSTSSSSATNDGYPPPPDLIFTPRLNGSQYNGTENGTTNGSNSHLTNGHATVKVNGDVIKNTQSPPLQSFSNHGDGSPALDSKDSTFNGVVLREGGNRQTSRDSELSRTSFGLGLGELSSDLMSAFDSWKT